VPESFLAPSFAGILSREPPEGIPINAGEAAFHKYITADLDEFERSFRTYLLRLASLAGGDVGG